MKPTPEQLFDRSYAFTKVQEGPIPTSDQVIDAVRKLIPAILIGGEAILDYVDVKTAKPHDARLFVEGMARKAMAVLDRQRVIELWPYNNHAQLSPAHLAQTFEALAVIVRWTFKK